MKKIRTRYAPSPTGYLHIGGARTALFSYLFAKKNKGDFIIRSEDTDIKRNINGGDESQINNLEWLGIIADESMYKPNPKYEPYKQSERLNIYNKYIDILIEKNLAYIAYDNFEELNKQKEEQKTKGIYSFRYNDSWLKITKEQKQKRFKCGEYTIRIKLPKNTIYSWVDMVRSKISINSDEIGDFIIRKKDGYPTYNFACIIDDHFMNITHVFRGEEHISNTPKQIALYKMLDWDIPIFAHFTIITNMEGQKLSKRDKALDQLIEDYKKNGYIAHSIFNFLSLLGWSPSHNNEIMSHQQIIKDFDINRMSKSPSKFDINKLNWFSNQYYKKLNIEELRSRLLPYIKDNLINKDNNWINLLLSIYQPQIYADYQIIELTKPFFCLPELSLRMENFLNTKESKLVIKEFFQQISNLEFTLDNIKICINKTKNITNQKGKNLFAPIRLILSHVEHGPELFKTIFLIGKKEVMHRLNEGMKKWI